MIIILTSRIMNNGYVDQKLLAVLFVIIPHATMRFVSTINYINNRHKANYNYSVSKTTLCYCIFESFTYIDLTFFFTITASNSSTVSQHYGLKRENIIYMLWLYYIMLIIPYYLLSVLVNTIIIGIDRYNNKSRKIIIANNILNKQTYYAQLDNL